MLLFCFQHFVEGGKKAVKTFSVAVPTDVVTANNFSATKHIKALECFQHVFLNFPSLPTHSSARENRTKSDNLCIYYARRPICFHWIFFSIDEDNWGWYKRDAANVYQIEKDVMYLNLIYVYLVTNSENAFSMGN